MKNSLETSGSRFEQTEERISKLKDLSIEIIPLKKNVQNLEDTFKHINICIMGIPKERRKEKGWIEYLKKQCPRRLNFDIKK
jgi:hypothetical protein